MSTQAQFDKAVSIVKGLPEDGPVTPTDDEKLAFYAHFKQANEGDNNTPAPGLFNFVGKAKHGAWKNLAGMSKEDAQAKYVELLREMLAKSNDESSKKYLVELDAAGAQA
ncbi:hypothetical protein L204_104589 [Cryptococcus depauperatus]|nr:long-chain fatty acid transporter [Cryptococcus depauperatus CBS 7855]